MSADQIVGVGGGRWAEHRVEGSLCLCLHPLSPTLLLVQFSVIRLVKYSTEWPLPLPLPPYPPLFPILPSQQTPISSELCMSGPYFLLFRSFQSPNFGCLVPTFCFLDRSNFNFWGFSFSLYNVLSR